MLKHLISGHIKMCSCQSNSQFRCENEFMALSQKLSFIMMHPTHALTRFKFYNQKPPPPIELISPCFSSEPRRPLNVLLSTLSVSFHIQAQHSLAFRITPPQSRDTFIYTAYRCNKEFKMKSGGTLKITCS